jgi:hypothetical protein
MWQRYKGAHPQGAQAAREALMKEPRVNLDRLVSQIALDCSLSRWFAYNRRRDEVLAAIALQRTRAKDTEGQVLDFLVRHCGGESRGT